MQEKGPGACSTSVKPGATLAGKGLRRGIEMGVFMILAPILVIWAIVALARGDTWLGGQPRSEHAESAIELLKRRYARGDISREEFEEKKKELVGG